MEPKPHALLGAKVTIYQVRSSFVLSIVMSTCDERYLWHGLRSIVKRRVCTAPTSVRGVVKKWE